MHTHSCIFYLCVTNVHRISSLSNTHYLLVLWVRGQGQPSAQDPPGCPQDISLAVFSSQGSEEESASRCFQVVGRIYLLVTVWLRPPLSCHLPSGARSPLSGLPSGPCASLVTWLFRFSRSAGESLPGQLRQGDITLRDPRSDRTQSREWYPIILPGATCQEVGILGVILEFCVPRGLQQVSVVALPCSIPGAALGNSYKFQHFWGGW